VSTAQSSLGSSDELSVLVPIEGVRASRLAFGNASAAAVSFGFWVKAHRTGSYSGSLRNSAKNRAYPFSFTVNAADTWEFKTVTVSGDSSGTWLTDTGVGLSINICIAGGSSRVGTAGAWAGSDYSGVTSTTNGVTATSDTFQVTGLIVLPGVELPSPDRAPFVTRPFDAELGMAQRYWEATYDYGVTPGTVSGSGEDGVAYAIVGATFNLAGKGSSFKVSKRVAPTITFYSPVSGSSGVGYSLADAADKSVAVRDTAGTKGFIWYASPVSNANMQIVLHWTADARF
jgi:hypothetical protein